MMMNRSHIMPLYIMCEIWVQRRTCVMKDCPTTAFKCVLLFVIISTILPYVILADIEIYSKERASDFNQYYYDACMQCLI